MEYLFGEMVRAKLKDRGWSNAELARRTDYSTTFIGNIIRGVAPGTKSGKLRLSEDIVDKISRVLGFSIEKARKAAGLLSDKGRRAAEYIDMLPLTQQDDAIAYLELMCSRYRQQSDGDLASFQIAGDEIVEAPATVDHNPLEPMHGGQPRTRTVPNSTGLSRNRKNQRKTGSS